MSVSNEWIDRPSSAQLSAVDHAVRCMPL